MKFRCKVHQMRTALVLVLVVGCGKPSDKVTREQCSHVADHVASVIVNHYTMRSDELWELIHHDNNPSDLPASVTKDNFKSYLATPEGRTWSMQALGAARVGTEGVIDKCIAEATPKQVNCLLATKTRDDVAACDQAK
jgi:hypothetical protein